MILQWKQCQHQMKWIGHCRHSCHRLHTLHSQSLSPRVPRWYRNCVALHNTRQLSLHFWASLAMASWGSSICWWVSQMPFQFWFAIDSRKNCTNPSSFPASGLLGREWGDAWYIRMHCLQWCTSQGEVVQPSGTILSSGKHWYHYLHQDRQEKRKQTEEKRRWQWHYFTMYFTHSSHISNKSKAH